MSRGPPGEDEVLVGQAGLARPGGPYQHDDRGAGGPHARQGAVDGLAHGALEQEVGPRGIAHDAHGARQRRVQLKPSGHKGCHARVAVQWLPLKLHVHIQLLGHPLNHFGVALMVTLGVEA